MPHPLRRCTVLAFLAAANLGACGSSNDTTASGPARTKTAASSPQTTATSEPVDVRVDLRRDGGSDISHGPARDPAVQRVVLINSSRFEATLASSSGSGGGSVGVPPKGSRTLRWRREAGPDEITTTVRVPGDPDRDFESKIPVK